MRHELKQKGRFSLSLRRKLRGNVLFSLSLSRVAVMLTLFAFGFGPVLVFAEKTSERMTEIVDVTVFVNPQHRFASDTNTGVDREYPLSTFQQAIHIAKSYLRKGLAVKVLLFPAVYRESVELFFSDSSGSLLIIEATKKGAAIISGAEIWKKWKETANRNIFVHDWPYAWGEAPFPRQWPTRLDQSPLLKRREMVFMGDVSLKQVLAQKALVPGTFFLSEAEKQIYIFPPQGKSVSTHFPEVATKATLLTVRGKNNVIVRGLVFQYASSPIQKSAVNFVRVTNLLLEDCWFRWNNWAGYQLYEVQDVMSRRNIASHNGAIGIVGSRIRSLISEDEETKFNNWRGADAGFFFWAVAGAKYLHVHNATFRRHIAQGNLAAGFWLDTDNRDISVEDSRMCGNAKQGFVVEASQGPIRISNTTIYRNDWVGLHILNSQDGIVLDSRIYGNSGAQIRVSGRKERSIKNWQTQRSLLVQNRGWKLLRNVVARGAVLLNVEGNIFIPTLRAMGNQWQMAHGSGKMLIEGKVSSSSKWLKQFHQDRARGQLSLNEDC